MSPLSTSVSPQLRKYAAAVDYLARSFVDFCPFCGEALDSGAAAFAHRRAHYCEHFEHEEPVL